MTILSTILKYNQQGTAGVVGENPYRTKAKFSEIGGLEYTDKLNKLTKLKFTVPNNEYTRANAFIERQAYFPLITPYRGIVLDSAKDKKEIAMNSTELAFHLTRRIFRNDEDDEVNYTAEKWFNKLWKHRAKYTVRKDHIEDEIKKVPINKNLGPNESFRVHAQLNGDDFVVTSKDGITKIPHEIESYDSITGDLVLWLRLPKVSDSSNIDFYVYYDNPAATNQEDIVNVWKGLYEIDTGTDAVNFSYDMVQHLNSSSVDSTENNNDGTDTAITYVPGKIGGAAQTDALTSEIDCASGTTLDDIFGIDAGGETGWVTCWFNANSDGEGSLGRVFDKGGFGGLGWNLHVRDEADDFVRFQFIQTTTSANGVWNTTAVDIPINKDIRVDIIYSKNSVSEDPIIYVNGVPRTVANGLLTEANTPTGTLDSDAAAVFTIGNEPGGTRTFDGEIDEVRVMKIPPANTANIIKTEYNIQNQPAVCIATHSHEEYARQADLIAEDIISSANVDMPIIKQLLIPNLVMHYKFDGDVLDETGNTTATVVGGPEEYGKGHFNLTRAYNFNGGGNELNLGTPSVLDFDKDTPFTFAGWVNINSTSNNKAFFYRGDSFTSTDAGVKIRRNSSNQVQFRITDDSGGDFTVNTPGDTFKSTDGWAFIAARHDGSGDRGGMRLTFNDVTVQGVAGVIGTMTLTLDVAIGSQTDGGNPLNGLCSNFMAFDRDLTDAEIVALKDATEPLTSDNKAITRIQWQLGEGEKLEIPNLVALWTLNNDLLDSKGENNGTYIGGEPEFVDVKYSKGLRFSDANTSVEIPHTSELDRTLTQAFTWSFWVLAETLVGTEVLISKKEATGSGDNGYAMFREGTKILFRMSDGTTSHDVRGATDSFIAGKIHHIICSKGVTADRDDMDTWIDGVKVSGVTQTMSGSTANNLPVVFNKFASGGSPGDQNRLDDVRYYDRKLTDVEILTLFAATDSGIDRIRIDNVPTRTTSIGYNFKNNWEALDELSLQLGKDLWFDNKNFIVNIGTKGKQIDEKLDIFITSKPEKKTENFANIINVVGKKEEGGSKLKKVVTKETVQRYNYEKVISNNKIAIEDQLGTIADSLIKEFQILTPQIKASIPYDQFMRFDIQSGDTIKISEPDKDVNGIFRFMDIKATRESAEVSLESVDTGVIRHRSSSLSDVLGSVLKKLNEDSLSS